jgi:hypothetical protein
VALPLVVGTGLVTVGGVPMDPALSMPRAAPVSVPLPRTSPIVGTAPTLVSAIPARAPDSLRAARRGHVYNGRPAFLARRHALLLDPAVKGAHRNPRSGSSLRHWAGSHSGVGVGVPSVVVVLVMAFPSFRSRGRGLVAGATGGRSHPAGRRLRTDQGPGLVPEMGERSRPPWRPWDRLKWGGGGRAPASRRSGGWSFQAHRGRFSLETATRGPSARCVYARGLLTPDSTRGGRARIGGGAVPSQGPEGVVSVRGEGQAHPAPPLWRSRGRFLVPSWYQVQRTRPDAPGRKKTRLRANPETGPWPGSDLNRLPADYETAALTR